MERSRGTRNPRSAMVAPGVRLHLLRSTRFATTLCRVVLQRDLGAEATATSLLSQVLQSATARHPTRAALAHRLADLYGAALHLTVSKLGDRQLLTGTLEWPTAFVPGSGRLLGAGLGLLREVFTRPKRAGRPRRRVLSDAPLDPELVATERLNLGRTLRALRDDRFRYAQTRCIAHTCSGEPHGLDALGREEDLEAATPEALAALHARLLARAPADIFLVGDLPWRAARGAVVRDLLWPRSDAAPPRMAPLVGFRPARARPRRVHEADRLAQAHLLATWRGSIPPASRLAAGAYVLAGVLGGSSSGRLFSVVRETHGLCYFADAGYSAAKGYLLVHVGVDPDEVIRVRRLLGRLVGELKRGRVEERAWRACREAAASEVAVLGDDRAALLGWHQTRALMGLDPSASGWLAGIEAVTAADVRRAARRLLPDTTYVLGPRPERRGGGRQ